jgi:crotonobetainyl-CoA:carnitine CoA-transferase CaiB-like acyl-CoA transferase
LITQSGLGISPMKGVSVLEIGHSVSAPYAGFVLANLGADVVKIEQPEGDPTRSWGPPFTDRSSITFEALNRDKSSVVANLKDPVVQAQIRQTISADVDVVLQNLRYGALERLGLGASELLESKPSLIVCNMRAYGHVGPLKEHPGYDPMSQAASGLMSLLGEDGSSPSRIPGSVIDIITGLWATLGILSALRERDHTGMGGEVDISLYETAISLMMLPILEYICSGTPPERLGSAHSTTSPSGAFRTANGWIMLGVANDAQFHKLFEVTGSKELVEDSRFFTNPDRVRNRKALHDLLDKVFLERSTEDWCNALESKDLPCSPVRNISEVVNHPQTTALGMLQASPDGMVMTMGLPLSFNRQRPSYESRAPGLGQHTDEILSQLGEEKK